MKTILSPIQVTERRGLPRLIRWRGCTYRVREMLDVWVYQTRWWGEEERRVYFRLWTNRGVMEVWRNGKKWMLAKVLD